MFAHTDIKQAPWFVVKADVKKSARLNCISHLLSMIPYKRFDADPAGPSTPSCSRGLRPPPPIEEQNFVPDLW